MGPFVFVLCGKQGNNTKAPHAAKNVALCQLMADLFAVFLGSVDHWCMFLQLIGRLLYKAASAMCSYST
jgi:hypothetical protein